MSEQNGNTDSTTLPELNLREFMNEVHQNALDHGFWAQFPDRKDVANPMVLGSKLCLIHQEISEAFDAARDGIDEVKDTHCPEHLNFTIELADTIIRILDLSMKLQLPIIEALLDKHAYNKTRPYLHGRKI